MKLSERQQQTIAVAVTILAGVVILAALLGLFWILARFFGAFSHVFLPLAVAGVGALVFEPYFDLLRHRLNLPPALALGALFLSIILPIVAFAAFFGVKITDQATGIANELLVQWSRLSDELGEHWMKEIIDSRVLPAIQGKEGSLVGGLGYFASTTLAAGANAVGWASGMLSWVVVPVYFAFFLMARRKDLSGLSYYLPFLKPETRRDAVFLAQEFVNIVVAFFRGQLIIAFLQGVFLAIGFSLIGLQYGIVLGFTLGFLNVIPYLGSMLGLAITLPLSWLQEGGGIYKLLGVLLVLLVVQTIEGYVLTPKIMGERTGLHPMAIMVAVFFWGSALGGILGMILAIPLTAFLVVLWRLAKDKYIPELV